MKKKIKFNNNPIMFFLLATIVVILISAIAQVINLGISYTTVASNGQSLENVVVVAKSLLNIEGFGIVVNNLMNEFLSFVPLQIVLIAFLSIGIASKSGILKTYSKKIFNKIPDNVFIFLTILIGLLANVMPAIGYGLLLPLTALIYIEKRIHPVAGLLAFFAGITLGYNANLMLSIEDFDINLISQMVNNVTDPNYTMQIMGNYYIMIIMTIILAFVGTHITKKHIIPKLGIYRDEIEELELTNNRENKAFKGSLIVFGFLLLLLIYGIIPGLPQSGMLLNLNAETYTESLFGSGSFLKEGAIFIFSGMLFIVSLVFGILSRNIKNNKDFTNGLTLEMKNIGMIVVLSLVISAFVLIINETNLLTILAVFLLNIFKFINLSGVTLIIFAFIIISLINILIPSSMFKWQLLAPVIIPSFAAVNISPEFAELVYKAGNSVTNGITPMFSYVVIILILIYNYTKNNDEILSLNKFFKLLMPYTIAFGITWLIVILSWYIIGLPIGIETFPLI